MAWKLKLLYDGDCPFCRREVEWLKAIDKAEALIAEDIAQREFDPWKYGLTAEDVAGRLHAIGPDGNIYKGMDAVRAAYEAVGLGWITAPTRWPILRPLADFAYRLFATNRVSLGRLFGRRCRDAGCR